MNQIELFILDTLVRGLSNAFFDVVMPLITWLGNSGRFWIAVAVVFLCIRATRKTGVTLAGALLLELALVDGLLKPLIGRARPFMLNPTVTLLITRPTDGSFPSGHTSTSFAAAFVIFHFNKKWGIAAYVLAALIAFSRLYLYVHFPSDVLGGMVIGTLIGMFTVWVADKAVDRWQTRQTKQEKETVSE